MGFRYEPHSDLCGCDRCAMQADKEHPAQVFDKIEDPEIMDCGCSVYKGCSCDQWYNDEME